MPREPHGAVEEDPDILDSIEAAAERAHGDDRAFLVHLNATFEQTARVRRFRGVPIVASGSVDRTSKSEQLLEDPRYCKNARALASRAQDRKRVIGGVQVALKEFLDCVAVGGDDSWRCTGTLIAPSVVLTAGHCESCATRVFFGNDVTRGGRTVSVDRVHRHPEYRKADLRNDVMVLVLSEEVLDIPFRAIASASQVDAAMDGRVVGFGNTDPLGLEGYGIKRQVDIAIATASCSATLDGVTDANRYRCFAGAELVAGLPLLAKDSCSGDSGGPFYIQGPTGWLLAGSTSRKTNATVNNCGDGGIYVRTEHYLPWIRQLPGVRLS